MGFEPNEVVGRHVGCVGAVKGIKTSSYLPLPASFPRMGAVFVNYDTRLLCTAHRSWSQCHPLKLMTLELEHVSHARFKPRPCRPMANK